MASRMSMLAWVLILTVLLTDPSLAEGSSKHHKHHKHHKKHPDPFTPGDLESVRSEYLAWIARVGNRTAPSSDLQTVDGVSLAKGVDNIITVNKNGGANYKKVQDAVDAVPKHSTVRITIQIAAGTYKEKVNIPSNKPYITFQGAGADVTKITWNDIAGDSSTYKSASVAVNSDHFIAQGISFENSAPAPPPGAVGKQAVALRISGDKAQFDSCSFYGAQDTLYDHKGRHYFKNCKIVGSIDFIFGNGQSLYSGCELHAIAKTFGSLTAQKRGSTSEDTGFSFINCKVTGTGMLYLGRAWGPASRVVFSYTYIADIIVPQGWYDWGDSSRQKTVFYGLYKCSGPGSVDNGFVSWAHKLTASQAAPFLTTDFIDGKSWVSI